jgi:glycosyltransferase involved in cell wall biosynthesis
VKTIGIQRAQYPERRNILSVNRDRVTFRELDSLPFVTQELREAAEKSAYFKEFAVPVNDCDGIDCLHFFNSIPLGNVPFVTTFETSVPRWWGVDLPVWHDGCRILAARECRRLFAISNNAIRIFFDSLSWCPEELHETIKAKTELLYPPQEVHPFIETKFESISPLKLVFIGEDFLRKGGLEILRAFCRAIDVGADLHLTIVSKMIMQGAQTFRWNDGHVVRLEEARRLMAARADRIRHHKSLSNDDVLRTLEESHVGILPSYGDTFGYVILEAQSRSVPMITTNIRAFPEINDAEVGWMSEIAIDEFGRPDAQVSLADMSDMLTKRLTELLLEIAELKGPQLASKAHLARQRVEQMHDPAKIADRLYATY